MFQKILKDWVFEKVNEKVNDSENLETVFHGFSKEQNVWLNKFIFYLETFE